jgi:hypothetical protein
MCVPGTTPCRSDTFAPICGGDCVSGELCVSFFSSCDCFEDCPGSCAAGSTCTSGVGPSVGNTFCVGDAQGRILCTGCTP